ncbi:hypothetical protein HMPREF3039_03185 [Akkermansia sp. KLE1798]|nr:hypothetical protein HMPREF3039_03185 [Akkermansia sp. KLE1798]KZA04088.1 hypothetical protein HMPREF1326_02286 [Akkermansia sp. KLE1605]
MVFILIALADWKNVSWAGEHPFFYRILNPPVTSASVNSDKG